jgi:translation initiation factor IF-3
MNNRGHLLPSGLSDLSQSVRVVGRDGKQIGLLTVMEAMQRAAAEQCELLTVAPDVKPPICRIVSRSELGGKAKRRE